MKGLVEVPSRRSTLPIMWNNQVEPGGGGCSKYLNMHVPAGLQNFNFLYFLLLELFLMMRFYELYQIVF